MHTRRNFLTNALAASVALGTSAYIAPGFRRAYADPKATAPRHYVTLFLRGGIDAVYTLDPKTKADVDSDVDVPYEQSAIVGSGLYPLGPHFAPLAPYTKQMAVVHGLQVHVANHEGGAYQMQRMRTGVMPTMPSIFEILGQSREQPVSSVTLGDLSSFDYTPASIIAPTGSGETAIEALDTLSDDDLDALARTYRKQVGQFSTTAASPRDAQTKEYLTQLADLFDKSKGIARFKPERWKGPSDTANDLQRTLWLIENDLAKSVHVKIQFDWDSHFRNADKQTRANADFMTLLVQFLDALNTRKNAHGTLASQTVVVVGSELGRFPVINGNLGKDHFPETKLMVFAPFVKAGSYGGTGRRMEGLKTSLTTGKLDDTGEKLKLDDLGTTMLHWAGVNPRVYGYHGRRLAFLEA